MALLFKRRWPECGFHYGKKERTGIMEINEKTRAALEECKESYPFVNWISGESLDVGKTEDFLLYGQPTGSSGYCGSW